MLSWDSVMYGLMTPKKTGKVPSNFEINRGKLVFGEKVFSWEVNRGKPLMDMFSPSFEEEFIDECFKFASPEEEAAIFHRYKQNGIVIPHLLFDALDFTFKSPFFSVFFNFEGGITPDLSCPGDEISWNEAAFYVPLKMGDTIKVDEDHVWKLVPNGKISPDDLPGRLQRI